MSLINIGQFVKLLELKLKELNLSNDEISKIILEAKTEIRLAPCEELDFLLSEENIEKIIGVIARNQKSVLFEESTLVVGKPINNDNNAPQYSFKTEAFDKAVSDDSTETVKISSILPSDTATIRISEPLSYDEEKTLISVSEVVTKLLEETATIAISTQATEALDKNSEEKTTTINSVNDKENSYEKVSVNSASEVETDNTVDITSEEKTVSLPNTSKTDETTNFPQSEKVSSGETTSSIGIIISRSEPLVNSLDDATVTVEIDNKTELDKAKSEETDINAVVNADKKINTTQKRESEKKTENKVSTDEFRQSHPVLLWILLFFAAFPTVCLFVSIFAALFLIVNTIVLLSGVLLMLTYALLFSLPSFAFLWSFAYSASALIDREWVSALCEGGVAFLSLGIAVFLAFFVYRLFSPLLKKYKVFLKSFNKNYIKIFVNILRYSFKSCTNI